MYCETKYYHFRRHNVYSITTKEITFQLINMCPKGHDKIFIYKKHNMYLSGSQVRRERTDHHAPSTKKWAGVQEEQKERMSAADRDEEGTFGWEKELRYHWMGRRGGCTQIER
jgi:hypothetical protein